MIIMRMCRLQSCQHFTEGPLSFCLQVQVLLLPFLVNLLYNLYHACGKGFAQLDVKRNCIFLSIDEMTQNICTRNAIQSSMNI